MKRLYENNEIAEPALFLMSNSSSYKYRHSLIKDGVWSII